MSSDYDDANMLAILWSFFMQIRTDWTKQELLDLFDQPFMDLLFEAQTVHRQNFDPSEVQRSKLLSIKTGACPEDCSYCNQSGHHNTGLPKEKLMEVEAVLEKAREAKAEGASRFCMGAAWRGPQAKTFDQVLAMVEGVKALGMETCMTLGMLNEQQATALADVGLDYYNHNLDTSPEYYSKVVSTRTFEQRLDTLEAVREAGINVCSGGILGMGETREDRAGLLLALATLPEHPQSVPINMLIPAPGTPLEDAKLVDNFEFIRTVAVARIVMPKSFVRLSAGRANMSDETQAWCFFAGANSLHMGETLLTMKNASEDHDEVLFDKLNLKPLDLEKYNQQAEHVS